MRNLRLSIHALPDKKDAYIRIQIEVEKLKTSTGTWVDALNQKIRNITLKLKHT